MQDFDSKLASFVDGAQWIINDYYAGRPRESIPTLQVSAGKRFVRIASFNQQTKGSSAYCFIDSTNGDVLKAASWKAPAKHARGNIFDEKNGLGLIGPFGPAYLR